MVSINSTSGKAVCAAVKPCMPKRASTPANSAEAIATGMRLMSFSNQPVMPNSVTSAALTINAPTASPILNPPATLAVASTAAPGVDHATMMGFL